MIFFCTSYVASQSRYRVKKKCTLIKVTKNNGTVSNKYLEKDFFRLVMCMGQRKFLSPDEEFGFLAPMLYHWTTETLRRARSIAKFIWHAFYKLLGSATSIALCFVNRIRDNRIKLTISLILFTKHVRTFKSPWEIYLLSSKLTISIILKTNVIYKVSLWNIFQQKKKIGVKIIFETKGDLNVPLLNSMNYLLSTRLTLTLHSFYNSLMEACIPTVQQ